MSERPTHAKALFAPLGPTYDRVGAILSFGQDPRWRRLPRLAPPAGRRPRPRRCDGDGPRRRRAARPRLPRHGPRPEPRHAGAGARPVRWAPVELVESSADAIPFADESFDHLTFTYLLRYVDDPGATLRSSRASSAPAAWSRCWSSASRVASGDRRGTSGWTSGSPSPAGSSRRAGMKSAASSARRSAASTSSIPSPRCSSSGGPPGSAISACGGRASAAASSCGGVVGPADDAARQHGRPSTRSRRGAGATT